MTLFMPCSRVYSRRFRRAKLGTMPSMVWIHGRDKIEVGKNVRYREQKTADPGFRFWHGQWDYALVTQINPDGYLFLERM